MSQYHVVAIKVTDLTGIINDIPIPKKGVMYQLLASKDTIGEAQQFKEHTRKSTGTVLIVVTDGVLKLYDSLYQLKRVLVTTN